MFLRAAWRKLAMYKSLIMVLAILLSAGVALAEVMSEEEIVDEVVTIEFTGVAMELFVGEMPGAPTFWTVELTDDEEAFCSEMINVTVYQATPGPWGTFDENVAVGDMVEVYGACVEDETECIVAVTLQGSEGYYFELAEDEVVVEETEDGEVVEDEVVDENDEGAE
jgi:hypothetical protein